MWARLQPNLGGATLTRAALSLLLAFVLWGWVTIERNPEVTRLVNGIPLSITQVPQQLQVTGQPVSIALRLQGPRDELDVLDPTQLRASVNLSGASGTGDVTVPVKATAPGHINVLDIYPPTVILHLAERGAPQR